MTPRLNAGAEEGKEEQMSVGGENLILMLMLMLILSVPKSMLCFLL